MANFLRDSQTYPQLQHGGIQTEQAEILLKTMETLVIQKEKEILKV